MQLRIEIFNNNEINKLLNVHHQMFTILCRVNNHVNSYHNNTVNNIHNDIVDRDVDQLHKISNEPHDEETNCCC